MALYLGNSEVSQKVGLPTIGVKLPAITEDTSGMVLSNDGTNPTWVEDNDVDYKNITNCLLENPKLVDVTLSEGTLTLKAGSTIIVPYGIEAPTMAIGDALNGGTITDISWDGAKLFYYVQYTEKTTTNTANQSNIFAFISSANGFNSALSTNSSITYSFESSWSLQYNTEENNVRYWNGDESTYIDNCSLPFVIYTSDSTKITSINQVFQSIGYIGSTVWCGKGVKGLAPNGRNEDGSLKNDLHIMDTVRVGNPTYSDSSLAIVNIVKDGNDYNVVYDWCRSYHEQEIQPTPSQYAIWFNIDENVIYQYIDGKWYPQNRFFLGKVDGSMNGLSYFKADTVSKIVNYSNTNFIAHQAMPSERYIDLTVGASETTYTAPADGYYWLNIASSQANGARFIYNIQTGLSDMQRMQNAGHACPVIMWARKNDTIRIQYDGTATSYGFKFVYAEGAY